MREIIKDTLELLQKVKKETENSNGDLDQSINNLKFILKEYKRLIDDFYEQYSSPDQV